MAASPRWKIYRNGEYVGCCKYAEDAARLVALSGGEIRDGHRKLVWREGTENWNASESYENCAGVIMERAESNAPYDWHRRLDTSSGA
jgi:hypothetical protein